MIRPTLAVLLLLPSFASAEAPLAPGDPARAARLPIGEAPPPAVAANERARLANGIRVAWAQARAAVPGAGMVQFSIVLPYAGSGYDPDGKRGLASLVAAVLQKAPQAEELADIAARYSVSAGVEGLTVTVRAASEKLDEAMALAAAVVRGPTLEPGEFAHAKRTLSAGIQMGLHDPKDAADRALAPLIYPGHPYGERPTVASVEAATLQDAQTLVARAFRTEGARVVGAGHETDAASFEAAVERHLGSWRSDPSAAPPPPALPRVAAAAPRAAMGLRVVDIPGSTQSAIRAGHRLVARDDPDYDVLNLLTYILMRGPQNRMDEQLRERMSISYGAHGDFTASKLGGSYVISAEVKGASTTVALLAIREQIVRIQNELIPDDELGRAKRMMIQIAAMRLGEVARLADTAAAIEAHDLPADQVMRGRLAVMAVTPERLRDAARRLLGADKLEVVIAGDAAAIVPGLEAAFGPVPVYDPSGTLKPRVSPGAGR